MVINCCQWLTKLVKGADSQTRILKINNFSTYAALPSPIWALASRQDPKAAS